MNPCLRDETSHDHGLIAQYTLEAMKEMAQGEAVDEQREKRWPNRTVAGTVEVEFKAWEEDSDYSEDENLGPNTRNTFTSQN